MSETTITYLQDVNFVLGFCANFIDLASNESKDEPAARKSWWRLESEKEKIRPAIIKSFTKGDM